MKKYIILFITLFFPTLFAETSPTLSEAEFQQWLNLMRYRPQFVSGYESQADGKAYFLTPKGKKDPLGEWHAFHKKILEDKSLACRFPARTHFWLKKTKINPEVYPLLHCQEFIEFFRKLDSHSLSMVFSSYYLNTPASAFGHTLLKYNRSEKMYGESNDLLDYASNYAAIVTTENALIYAVMGIVGGFRGEFAVMPYFYKVREYNDYESRELWDYELNLTPEQRFLVIAGLWEMKQTYFSYLYFTENCSYHMLAMLAAAEPSWQLLENLPLIVAPVDTIKALKKVPGLIKKINYRPSIGGKVDFYYEEFKKTQAKEEIQKLKDFFEDIQKQRFSSALQHKKQLATPTLDLLIDFVDFIYPEEVNDSQSTVALFKNDLLTERSSRQTITPKPFPPPPATHSPHLSHDRQRVAIGYAYQEIFGRALSGEFRFALHDFLDPSGGQPEMSTMEMGKFRFKYYDDYKKTNHNRLIIDEFSILNVESFPLQHDLFSRWSWSARVGLGQDERCQHCFKPIDVEIGGGKTFGKRSLHTTFMAHLEVAQSHRFKNNWRLNPGLKWKSIAEIDDLNSAIELNLRPHYTMLQDEKIFTPIDLRWRLRSQFSSLAFETHVGSEDWLKRMTYSGRLLWYY